MRRPISHPLALARLRDAQFQDGSVSPLAAAIAIATHNRPGLSVNRILETIAALAAEVRTMAAKGNALYGSCNHILFDRHGFRGNREHYDDPQNSYIDCVLKNRTGLPILLSLLYVETIQRAGGVAFGIGLPGHFIAAVEHNGNPILLDPFNAGRQLTVNECRDLAKAAGAAWSDDYLAPIDGRKWALRILANLRNVYAQMSDAANLAAVVEQMLLLAPEMGGLQQDLHRVYNFLDEQAAKNN